MSDPTTTPDYHHIFYRANHATWCAERHVDFDEHTSAYCTHPVGSAVMGTTLADAEYEITVTLVDAVPRLPVDATQDQRRQAYHHSNVVQLLLWSNKHASEDVVVDIRPEFARSLAASLVRCADLAEGV